MRTVIQRVKEARVETEGRTPASIGPGLLILLGICRDDTARDADYLADKVAGLRIFGDANGKMNLDIGQVSGSALVVSQFTLYGDCRRGRRPGFDRAAAPDQARVLYEYFVTALRELGVPVETGIFRATMQVFLVNDGPVTILCDSEDRPGARTAGQS
jgi:D-aminoacyl-tRNA deacylase